MRTVQEGMNKNKTKKLMENITKGKFTIRDMRDQFA